MCLFHVSVTLSSIFASTVLVDVHCQILIIYINYLSIIVISKIKSDICFVIRFRKISLMQLFITLHLLFKYIMDVMYC